MSSNFGRPQISDPFSAFIAGRRDKEQRVFQQRDKTLDFLQQIAGSASPEYHDTLVDLMSQVVGASGDKKGQKQIQDALGQIHQITKGLGPNVQNKTNDFAGYQGAGAENSITPTAPTASTVNDNISAAISNPNTTAAPAGPVSMLGRYGSSANFATPTSLTAPVGAPATAPVSLVGNDDIQGGGLMAQPPAAGGVSMIKAPAPVQLNSTVAKPGFQVQGRVPLIEDPVARKLREQQALNPGLIDLYRGKTDATTQSKIAINSARISDQMDKDLAEIDPKMRAQMKIGANRDVLKMVADLGGNPDNPDDIKAATSQLTAKIKQDFEEHRQRIAEHQQNIEASKSRVKQADDALEVRRAELEQRKVAEGNTAAYRQQKIGLDKIANDLKPMNQRLIAQRAKISRLANDPRLMGGEDPNGPHYNPQTTQLKNELANQTNILHQMEDDYQSASEGNPGGAIAAREAASGGTAAAGGYKKGQIITKKDGTKVVVDSVGPDGKPLVLPYP